MEGEIYKKITRKSLSSLQILKKHNGRENTIKGIISRRLTSLVHNVKIIIASWHILGSL